MSEPQTPEAAAAKPQPKPEAAKKEMSPSELMLQDIKNRMAKGAGSDEVIDEVAKKKLEEQDEAGKKIITEKIPEDLRVFEGTEREMSGASIREQAFHSQEIQMKLVANGLDGLSGDEQDYVIEMVKRSIIREPSVVGYIQDMMVLNGVDLTDPENVDEVGVKILEDTAVLFINLPGYREALRRAAQEKIKADVTPIDIKGLDFSRSDDLANLDEEISKAKKDSREFSEIVVDVDETGEPVQRPGKKWEALSRNQKIVSETQAAYEQMSQEFEDSLLELGISDPSLADIDVLIDEAGRRGEAETVEEYVQLLKLKKDIDTSPYVDAKNVVDQIEMEHAEAERRISTLESEKSTVQADVAQIERDIQDPGSDISRVLALKKYAGEIDNAYGIAVVNVLHERSTEDSMNHDDTAKEAAKNTTDSMAKSLLEGLSKRFGEVKMEHGTPSLKGLNRGMIREAKNTLFLQDPRMIALGIVNPYTGKMYTEYDLQGMTEDRIRVNFEGKNTEMLMTRIILSSDNPAKKEGMTPDEIKDKQKSDPNFFKWTAQEIADKKQADPKFFEKQQDIVVKSVVRKAALLGEMKADAATRDAIEKSKWGSDILKNALEDPTIERDLKIIDEADKKAAEEAKKHEAPDKRAGSFKEYIWIKKKEIVKNKAVILSFALGGPATMLFVLYGEYLKEKLHPKKAKTADKDDHKNTDHAGHKDKEEGEDQGSGQGEEGAEATHENGIGGSSEGQSSADAGHAAAHH